MRMRRPLSFMNRLVQGISARAEPAWGVMVTTEKVRENSPGLREFVQLTVTLRGRIPLMHDILQTHRPISSNEAFDAV